MSRPPDNALKIFEVVRKAGLAGRAGPIAARVLGAPLKTLGEVSASIEDLTSASSLERASNVHTHAAALSLGGGRQWCGALECRRQRARELSQFALLYSDRVYIDSFLAGYDSRLTSLPSDEGASIRNEFLEDLEVLYTFKPSLEAGVVVPFSPRSDVCLHCLAGPIWGKDGEKRLERLHRSLRGKFAKEVGATLAFDGDRYSYDFNGPDYLIDHSSSTITYGEPPPGLEELPRIWDRVEAGDEVVLSRYARERLGVDGVLSESVMQNVAFELSTVQSLGTTFLTDREVHITALAELAGNAELAKRNALVRKHLTTLVPFAEDVPFSDLVKIRRNEAEAFVAYRAALSRAVEEYRNKSEAFTDITARQLYSDVIEPSLARLDQRVSDARRSVLKSAARTTMGWVGAISFGMYSGFVPSDIAKAAAALGMTKVLADLVSNVLSVGDAKSTTRGDDFYFLWKVQSKSKRRRGA